jgi:large subunit ribosomal protein L10
MTLEQKQAIVSEVAAVAGSAPSAIAAQYSGLSVSDMTALRRSARDAGVFLKVVRNTLARRALQGTRFECMHDGLTGPLVLAFSGAEPGSAARVIRDFAKQHDKLIVKLVSIDGRLLGPSGIDALASLPTLDQARAMLLGLMQAPLGKLVRVLAEPQAKFARLLAAWRDSKQAAGG